MELVNRLGMRAAIFRHLPFIKRTGQICLALAAAVFSLQFYCIRELVFMEAVVVLGFVILALIVAGLALVCLSVLWLGKIGSALKVARGFVIARHREPFTALTTTALFEVKEEIS